MRLAEKCRSFIAGERSMTVVESEKTNSILDPNSRFNEPRVRVVDFMIIGAQKSGTTTLAAQLSGHPEVCFCKIKEPGFFSNHVDWAAKVGKYHSLYSPQNGQICGEASTMYTFYPEVLDTHERLYRYNPKLKLIYIMRHPVERVVSLYAHNVVRNIEKLGPEAAVFSQPAYINRSRYAVQIRPYIELFGRENVLLLIFEEYITDQTSILNQVAQFLSISEQKFCNAGNDRMHRTVGVPYLKYEAVRQLTNTDLFQSLKTYVPREIRHFLRNYVSNTLEEKPEFSASLKQSIRRLLVDDIQSIEDLLGRKIEAWKA